MSPRIEPGVVEVQETRRGQFQVEVRTGEACFLADEPEAVGGLGSGPTPYELLASALGACTAMTVRMYAGRKGWPLEDVTVRLLHRRPGPQARDHFAREIVLKGALTDDQRSRLLEIANRCPVHQTLERGAEIVTVLAETPHIHGPRPADDDHVRDMADVCTV
ncbi:OsmC family protein [Phenylobacterium sp. J367]|uniref:OsmC family protein n=1 Tax=Phenylobacterium sp. J367 TaxID=2898435 RepID=UPI00215158A6|nr:OsmC family protein [Phenylobacterium sp. J367]MCR5881014.1 OsmC family protein [Phenylobacterium sp. J367]